MTEERLIRWQNYRITQLGFVNNILIVTASLLLVFLLTHVTKLDVSNTENPVSQCQINIIYVSTVLMLLSILFGIATAINRLNDFSKTVQLIKAEVNKSKKTHELKALKEETKIIGKRTWILLYTQIISFLFGIILLFSSILLIL